MMKIRSYIASLFITIFILFFFDTYAESSIRNNGFLIPYQPTIHNESSTTSTINVTPLCGEYTIGGEGADFNSFAEAVAALNADGISCPVIFKVRDGTYNEQLQIDSIPGASLLNTVTFESESQDSSKVLLLSDGSYTIQLRNAEFIILGRISVVSNNGNTIEITDQSGYLIINHCQLSANWMEGSVINALPGSHVITLTGNIISSNWTDAFTGSGIDTLVITNNGLLNADINVTNSLNLLIKNNNLSLYSEINIDNSQDISVLNNILDLTEGIWITNNTNVLVSANKILNVANTSGINLNSSDAVVVNNFIHITGDISSAGIKVGDAASGSKILFNSINVTNTNLGSRALDISGGNGYTIKDNIFCNREGGYAAYVNVDLLNNDWDYNDYFSRVGQIGYKDGITYHEISEWGNAINGDAHSMAVNPLFTSDTDLSINQILLNDAGIPVPGITIDIDSTLRNPVTPDIGAREYAPCPIDAGVKEVSQPVSPVEPGIQFVKVILQNHGTETLNSVTVQWIVKGQWQPSYFWSGSLPGGMSNTITIGEYDFVSGSLYDIKAWTMNPNGQADCDPYNDTTVANLVTVLCGEYTIGGSGADFPNLTQAVSVLNLAGVMCPVTFRIRDGIYTEQIRIDSVAGASSTNTVTFTSESGDSSLVKIIYAPSPDNNYVVLLNNTHYLIFEKIGISVSGENNSLKITNHSDNISIRNCLFTDDGWAVTIEQGSRDITITGNTLDQTRGIISESSPYTFISSNKIIRTSNSNGISLNSLSSTIANNFIHISGTSDYSGIFLDENASGSKVVFNSIQVANSHSESSALKIASGRDYIIKNNIFSNTAAGYCAYVGVPLINADWNNNDYFSTTSKVGYLEGTIYTSLGEWGNAINGDTYSLQVNPLFISDTNLRPLQKELNKAGTPIQGILTDIDGDSRNAQTPDIGADEFPYDLGIVELISPDSSCAHTTRDTVIVYLNHSGAIPFIDQGLDYQVNGGIENIDTKLGAINEDTTFTFTSTVNMYAYGEYVFRIWLLDANDDNPSNDTLIAIRHSYPVPTVDFGFNSCNGASVAFTSDVYIIPPYQIDKYEWDFGDGDTSGEINPVHTYTASGLYSVNLKTISNKGCTSEISRQVDVDVNTPILNLALVQKNESCPGKCNGRIEAIVTGGIPPYLFQLNGEVTDQTIIPDLCPGTYRFLITDNRACQFADTAYITTNTMIDAEFHADITSGNVPLDVSFTFTGTNPGSFNWDFGDGSFSEDQNPLHTFIQGGDFIVNLIVNSDSPDYCSDSSYITITVRDSVYIKVYNVITPNGDGMNDYFEVDSEGLTALSVIIFDRWGQRIHEIKDLNGRWDGRAENGEEVVSGTYFYVLQAKVFNGKEYKKQGVISVLR
jgi:gliding motility-associated-like protein